MWSKHYVFILTTFEEIMQNRNWEDRALEIFNSCNQPFEIHTFCFLAALRVPYCLYSVYTSGPAEFALLNEMFPLLSLSSTLYILPGVEISQEPLSSAVKFFKGIEFKSMTKKAL